MRNSTSLTLSLDLALWYLFPSLSQCEMGLPLRDEQIRVSINSAVVLAPVAHSASQLWLPNLLSFHCSAIQFPSCTFRCAEGWRHASDVGIRVSIECLVLSLSHVFNVLGAVFWWWVWEFLVLKFVELWIVLVSGFVIELWWSACVLAAVG